MADHLNEIILVPTLFLAAFFDIKSRKIPNLLTFPVILWGLLFTTIYSGSKGFQFSIFGFLFGTAVFFIPFTLNMMGGGDVKLMAAIGALMGWKFSLSAVLYSSLAGALIVLIMYLFNRRIQTIFISLVSTLIKPLSKWGYLKTGNKTCYKTFHYFDHKTSTRAKEYIPYGAAIAIGTLLVLYHIVPTVI